jgi:1-acyl-sn-glycerol-3-phosphate acyltransferase
MKKKIYSYIFYKIIGWKIEGQFDESIKKCVFIVVPHTSWHDFFMGLLLRGVMNTTINFVGKKELFNFPLGWYFRLVGGEPLDRSGGNNKVDSIVNIFNQKELFRLAMSPEGTRKKVTDFRTGFYYISKKANVPIVPVAFDFGNKKIVFHQPFTPTDSIEKDMEYIKSLYRGVKGKIAEYSFE